MVLAHRLKPEEVTQNFLLKNKECKKLLYGESISICLNRARKVVSVLLTEHARNIEYSLPFKFLRLWNSNLKWLFTLTLNILKKENANNVCCWTPPSWRLEDSCLLLNIPSCIVYKLIFTWFITWSNEESPNINPFLRKCGSTAIHIISGRGRCCENYH